MHILVDIALCPKYKPLNCKYVQTAYSYPPSAIVITCVLYIEMLRYWNAFSDSQTLHKRGRDGIRIAQSTAQLNEIKNKMHGWNYKQYNCRKINKHNLGYSFITMNLHFIIWICKGVCVSDDTRIHTSFSLSLFLSRMVCVVYGVYLIHIKNLYKI